MPAAMTTKDGLQGEEGGPAAAEFLRETRDSCQIGGNRAILPVCALHNGLHNHEIRLK
jgi:hypothetical protein